MLIAGVSSSERERGGVEKTGGENSTGLIGLLESNIKKKD